MKYILIAATFLLINSGNTQTKAPVKKPAAPVNPLKNMTDSASYAIGMSVATFYMQQGMKNLNPTVISKAISDILAGRKALLTDEQANNIMMQFINQGQEAKAKPNISAGQKFLATNKTKQGVRTTPSGLQYEVITEGTGIKPTASDTVVTHYRGTLIDGTEFDNSYNRGQPATFPVGGVIKGWTEALQLMPAGSKYKLYIPHNLAYGTNETGPIPAGSVLIFEVELLEVKKKQ
jgi:FKBP-type peptidyl-prolyl cis-trans isomerase FklB